MLVARSDAAKVLALVGLTLPTYLLSTRYQTSASFERPVHFTFVSLSLTGLILTGLSRWQSHANIESLAIFSSHEDGNRQIVKIKIRALKLLQNVLDKGCRLHSSFVLLLCCVGLRTWLYWAIIRTTQCSRGGLEAFLPFLTFIAEAIRPWTFHLGLQSDASVRQTPMISAPSKTHIIFAFIVLSWPLFVISATESAQIATGTLCPIGWRWETSIPYVQLIKSMLDAIMIVHMAHLVRTLAEDEVDVTGFLGKLSLVAAGVVFSLSFPGWLSDSEFVMAFRFHYIDVVDFCMDGVLASVALVCGLYLLPALHPSCVSLVAAGLGFLGSQTSRLAVLPFMSSSASNELAKHTCLAIVLAALLWVLAVRLPASDKGAMPPMMQQSLLILGMSFVLLSFATWFFIDSPAEMLIETAVKKLMSEASVIASEWESQASVSTTLAEAVEEYKKRYGMLPPPNFDKWYDFAVEHKSPVIDDFDQINDDLFPFWAKSPPVIRADTAKLFAYASTEMGAMRIRDGKVEQSPHIPGSHRWMTDTIQRMVEPFSEWLPDMDIAINLADECRMGVSFEHMEHLKRIIAIAEINRNLGVAKAGHNSWSNGEAAQWPAEFIEPMHRADEGNREVLDPSFINNVRRQIFYDWVAASCPPTSKTRASRWWDWSSTCVGCMAPHSLATRSGALVRNATLAHDLCHQPDIAYLDGFLMSPAAMLGTHDLLPIFSQSRVSGFSDILFPSPWNFNDKSAFNEDAAMSWEKKVNGLFWRGSASDGFAAHRRWVGFLRSRFVHEAYDKAKELRSRYANSDLTVNVSFTGGMAKCDGRECEMELDSFELWGKQAAAADSSTGGETSEGRLPPSVPFDEHWRYRHLMDMDGAGFSGRFLSFLESHSLPYRAALFRTWYDERIQPWLHYVPVDIRLGSGFWAVLDYFGGSGGEQGSNMARHIAEQGRDWARKGLRKEDMQIYMFRLLLEWGRIVHDDRDNLGFKMGG